MATPAYVPQIGALLRQGFNYDMAVSERVTFQSEATQHPIEDPARSFIYDHNREQPTEMSLSVVVSMDPLLAGVDNLAVNGIERLTQIQDTLLAMRSAQAVATNAFFDVYTGLRVYRNMGITSLTFSREPETPNMLEIEIDLIEFRFARPPRSEDKVYKMDANDGPRNYANAELVDDRDRMIVEARRDRYSPRMLSPDESGRAALRSSIRKLPEQYRKTLAIDTTNGAISAESVSLISIDNAPSQKYTLRIDGNDHDLIFDYNQMADRWSFSVGLSDADCPKVAGKFIEPGLNLLAGISSTQMLIPLDRPGISTSNVSWYARLSAPLGDGISATMLAYGSNNAFNGMFRPRTSLAC